MKPPATKELNSILGSAADTWGAIVTAIEEQFSPLERQWKPSTAEFGRICLLQHKKRTLLYLTPGKGEIVIAIVLGERAAAIAAKSSLPARIRKLIAEARRYAEGRGIRFPVKSSKDISIIKDLVAIKTTPK